LIALPASLFFEDPPALLTQPTLQFGDERSAALMTRSHALLRRRAVDLALDGEQDIDALDRLDCGRHLVDPRQIEELASPVRPAGSLHDRCWLAALG
jgi:hypothetical protein